MVPSNIQNLTRKVRKHLSAKEQKDEIIAVLYPTDDPNKISDYCSSAGRIKDILHSTKPISIASAYLTICWFMIWKNTDRTTASLWV